MRNRAALALAISALTGCVPQSGQPAAVAANTSPPVVAFVLPKMENLSKHLVLNGEFRANRSVDLHSRVAGFISEIRFDVGASVRKGEVLATLHVPEMDADMAQAAAERRRYDAELSRARAALTQELASLKLSSLSLDRLVAAAKAEPGIVAQQEIDAAIASKSAAEARVESARAAIAVEQSRVAVAQAAQDRSESLSIYRRLVAPFDGVIVKRYVDPGALAQPAPVLRIAELSQLRLAVQVPESLLPLIRPGVAVSVKVGSLNKRFQSRIARLSGDVSAASRTMEVELDIPNSARELSPGMYAEVTVDGQSKSPGFTVPITAVGNNGGNRSVFLVSSAGIVEERMIRTGMEMPGSFEVLEGLMPEDRIVVSNRSLLRPGLRVDARPAGDR